MMTPTPLETASRSGRQKRLDPPDHAFDPLPRLLVDLRQPVRSFLLPAQLVAQIVIDLFQLRQFIFQLSLGTRTRGLSTRAAWRLGPSPTTFRA